MPLPTLLVSAVLSLPKLAMYWNSAVLTLVREGFIRMYQSQSSLGTGLSAVTKALARWQLRGASAAILANVSPTFWLELANLVTSVRSTQLVSSTSMGQVAIRAFLTR